ncbi:MAG: hypothetical protein ACYSTZ_02590 [Planctomycetota bacterium]|jgi:hypothetical protein
MPSAEPSYPIPKPTQGIIKNVPATTIGFDGLVDAKNWIYRNSNFFVRPGLTDFADDINERPMGFIQYDHANESDRFVMGTTLSWWHYNSGAGTWTDLDGAANPLTGGNTAHVMFRTFESGGTVKLIGVNGVDAPKIWTGAGNYADLGGGPPATASSIAIAADRVLMSEGDSLYYSGNLDETDWTAGAIRLAETPGNIIGMLEFGNRATAIYKDDSIYMAYAQVDLIAKFRIELVRAGIPGPVSPAAIFPLAEMGLHCYLSDAGAVMLFDGGAPVSMGDHIQTHIRQTRDYDLRKRSHGFYDPLQNEIYVFYPTIGSSDVNSCVVIDFETRAMHYYVFDNHTITAGCAATLTDAMNIGEFPVINNISLTFGEMDRGSGGILLGDTGGQVYHHAGLTDDGSAVQHHFETGLKMLGERRRYGMMHASDHLFGLASGSQDISIQFGVSDYGEAPVYETAQTIDIGAEGPYWLSHRLPGRLYALKMSGSASKETYWIGSEANGSELGLR